MLKRLLALTVAMLAGAAVFAQTFTVTPNNPTAEDRITIKIDVTGFAPLENETALYVWAWSNLGDAPNGTWNNSNESAKMTQDATNPKVWTFSFVPTTYYNFPAGSFQFVGFLVKGKDGAPAAPGEPERKTADQRINLDPINFVDTPVRFFPAKFTEDDVVTVFYDKTLDDNVTMRSTNDISVFTQVRVRDAAGVESGWVYTTAEWPDVENNASLAMRQVPGNDSLYRWTIIPSRFFAKQPGEQLIEIKVHVRSKTQPVFGGPTPPASKGDELRPFEPKRP